METLRRRLHRFAWIALVAMLGVALAPLVSHARAASSDGPWAEVCSTMPGATAAPAGEVVDHGHADHCALCAQLGAAPLPATAVLALPRSVGQLGTPETVSPFARLAWRAAQPRGPPVAA